MADIESKQVARFVSTVLAPMSNYAVGLNAKIDAETVTWTDIAAILDPFDDDDVVICDAQTDGTPIPTKATIVAAIAAFAALNATIKDAGNLAHLSRFHTRIDVPGS